jgi:hypothetical protein
MANDNFVKVVYADRNGRPAYKFVRRDEHERLLEVLERGRIADDEAFTTFDEHLQTNRLVTVEDIRRDRQLRGDHVARESSGVTRRIPFRDSEDFFVRFFEAQGFTVEGRDYPVENAIDGVRPRTLLSRGDEYLLLLARDAASPQWVVVDKDRLFEQPVSRGYPLHERELGTKGDLAAFLRREGLTRQEDIDAELGRWDRWARKEGEFISVGCSPPARLLPTTVERSNDGSLEPSSQNVPASERLDIRLVAAFMRGQGFEAVGELGAGGTLFEAAEDRHDEYEYVAVAVTGEGHGWMKTISTAAVENYRAGGETLSFSSIAAEPKPLATMFERYGLESEDQLHAELIAWRQWIAMSPGLPPPLSIKDRYARRLAAPGGELELAAAFADRLKVQGFTFVESLNDVSLYQRERPGQPAEVLAWRLSGQDGEPRYLELSGRGAIQAYADAVANLRAGEAGALARFPEGDFGTFLRAEGLPLSELPPSLAQLPLSVLPAAHPQELPELVPDLGRAAGELVPEPTTPVQAALAPPGDPPEQSSATAADPAPLQGAARDVSVDELLELWGESVPRAPGSAPAVPAPGGVEVLDPGAATDESGRPMRIVPAEELATQWGEGPSPAPASPALQAVDAALDTASSSGALVQNGTEGALGLNVDAFVRAQGFYEVRVPGDEVSALADGAKLYCRHDSESESNDPNFDQGNRYGSDFGAYQYVVVSPRDAVFKSLRDSDAGPLHVWSTRADEFEEAHVRALLARTFADVGHEARPIEGLLFWELSREERETELQAWRQWSAERALPPLRSPETRRLTPHSRWDVEGPPNAMRDLEAARNFAEGLTSLGFVHERTTVDGLPVVGRATLEGGHERVVWRLAPDGEPRAKVVPPTFQEQRGYDAIRSPELLAPELLAGRARNARLAAPEPGSERLDWRRIESFLSDFAYEPGGNLADGARAFRRADGIAVAVEAIHGGKYFRWKPVPAELQVNPTLTFRELLGEPRFPPRLATYRDELLAGRARNARLAAPEPGSERLDWRRTETFLRRFDYEPGRPLAGEARAFQRADGVAVAVEVIDDGKSFRWKEIPAELQASLVPAFREVPGAPRSFEDFLVFEGLTQHVLSGPALRGIGVDVETNPRDHEQPIAEGQQRVADGQVHEASAAGLAAPKLATYGTERAYELSPASAAVGKGAAVAPVSALRLPPFLSYSLDEEREYALPNGTAVPRFGARSTALEAPEHSSAADLGPSAVEAVEEPPGEVELRDQPPDRPRPSDLSDPDNGELAMALGALGTFQMLADGQAEGVTRLAEAQSQVAELAPFVPGAPTVRTGFVLFGPEGGVTTRGDVSRLVLWPDSSTPAEAEAIYLFGPLAKAVEGLRPGDVIQVAGMHSEQFGLCATSIRIGGSLDGHALPLNFNFPSANELRERFAVPNLWRVAPSLPEIGTFAAALEQHPVRVEHSPTLGDDQVSRVVEGLAEVGLARPGRQQLRDAFDNVETYLPEALAKNLRSSATKLGHGESFSFTSSWTSIDQSFAGLSPPGHTGPLASLGIHASTLDADPFRGAFRERGHAIAVRTFGEDGLANGIHYLQAQTREFAEAAGRPSGKPSLWVSEPPADGCRRVIVCNNPASALAYHQQHPAKDVLYVATCERAGFVSAEGLSKLEAIVKPLTAATAAQLAAGLRGAPLEVTVLAEHGRAMSGLYEQVKGAFPDLVVKAALPPLAAGRYQARSWLEHCRRETFPELFADLPAYAVSRAGAEELYRSTDGRDVVLRVPVASAAPPTVVLGDRKIAGAGVRFEFENLLFRAGADGAWTYQSQRGGDRGDALDFARTRLGLQPEDTRQDLRYFARERGLIDGTQPLSHAQEELAAHGLYPATVDDPCFRGSLRVLAGTEGRALVFPLQNSRGFCGVWTEPLEAAPHLATPSVGGIWGVWASDGHPSGGPPDHLVVVNHPRDALAFHQQNPFGSSEPAPARVRYVACADLSSEVQREALRSMLASASSRRAGHAPTLTVAAATDHDGKRLLTQVQELFPYERVVHLPPSKGRSWADSVLRQEQEFIRAAATRLELPPAKRNMRLGLSH